MDPNNQQPQPNSNDINKSGEGFQNINTENQVPVQTPQPMQDSVVNHVAPQVPSPVQQTPTIPAVAVDPTTSGQPPEPGAKKNNLVLTVALGLMALSVVVAIAYVVGSKIKSSKKPQETTLPVAIATPTSAPVVEPSNSTSSAAPSSAPLAITDKTIDIKSFAYNPTTITVKAGETIMVTNSDTVAHSVTEDSGLFDTGLLAAGETKTFIAPSKAGVYKYHCSAHLNMTATLTVE